ncbi:MAG TPA: TIGR01777 family oxidoreductase [Nocardioides sp.]|uniref:TIGR01777 family oxidoreductase n=1 Tax=Nocardioides sp. TaxID=35761 RepID=UPI002E3227CD|nr:TIGR01777 family oxidoreductase [Nocardioides sp.]HEX5088049.1 TIGR01777 family oxidoreductase [Nocardioides sp.]
MRVVIAGSSGFLGSHVAGALRRVGHTVTGLTRLPTDDPTMSTWDPGSGRYDPDLFEQADAVIGVTGSSLFRNPRSRSWQRELFDSRVQPTRVLAEAVASSSRKPTFLSGNGSSWYGDHGSEPVEESSESRGDALLTQVTRAWQDATEPARAAGARVVVLRTAPVMDRRGITLRLLTALFTACLGGRLGDGRQGFPVISLRDWVGAAVHALHREEVEGPVNLCCPETPTNAEFTAALAQLVHRPALLPAPAPLIRAALGPAAPELLRSLDLVPKVLQETGYQFRDPDVAAVLRAGTEQLDG